MSQVFHSLNDPNALTADSEGSPSASPKKSKARKSKAKAAILSETEEIPDSEEDLGHFQSQLVDGRTAHSCTHLMASQAISCAYTDSSEADCGKPK